MGYGYLHAVNKGISWEALRERDETRVIEIAAMGSSLMSGFAAANLDRQ
jgi:hypothetical protein